MTDHSSSEERSLQEKVQDALTRARVRVRCEPELVLLDDVADLLDQTLRELQQEKEKVQELEARVRAWARVRALRDREQRPRRPKR